MGVGDRHDLARRDHDQRVDGVDIERRHRVRTGAFGLPLAQRRIENREARQDVAADVVVGKPGLGGEPGEVAVGLLHADDIGVGGLDRLDHLGERDLLAAVPDVEAHHLELHRVGRHDKPEHQQGGSETAQHGNFPPPP